jgi:hypothetical protein
VERLGLGLRDGEAGNGENDGGDGGDERCFHGAIIVPEARMGGQAFCAE